MQKFIAIENGEETRPDKYTQLVLFAHNMGREKIKESYKNKDRRCCTWPFFTSRHEDTTVFYRWCKSIQLPFKDLPETLKVLPAVADAPAP